MKYIKSFNEKFILEENPDIKKSIMNLKKLPKEYKEIACILSGSLTKAKNGVVTGLNLHDNLKKKIEEGGYPSGFSMGVDKNGYFIHTHRGRSKSYESPEKIPVKDIKFIDSTG